MLSSIDLKRYISPLPISVGNRGNMVTDDVAEQIRRDYEQGLTYRQLAKKYRKSFRDISAILKCEEKPKPGEVISAELPNYFKKQETKNLLNCLMVTGKLSELNEEFAHDIREIVFNLIAELAKKGWTRLKERFLQPRLPQPFLFP